MNAVYKMDYSGLRLEIRLARGHWQSWEELIEIWMKGQQRSAVRKYANTLRGHACASIYTHKHTHHNESKQINSATSDLYNIIPIILTGETIKHKL